MAALKLGWDQISGRYPYMHVDFFGAPFPHSKMIILKDGQILVTDERAKSFVVSTIADTDKGMPLGDFDLVAICGPGIITMLELYKTCRTDEFNGQGKADCIVSDECFVDAAADRYRAKPAMKLAADLARFTRSPVWVLPQPFPAENFLEARRGALVGRVINSGDEKLVLKAYQNMLLRLETDKLKFCPQPMSTQGATLFTDSAYSNGSRRLKKNFDVAHSDEDGTHMNAEFGAIRIIELLRRAIEAGQLPESSVSVANHAEYLT